MEEKNSTMQAVLALNINYIYKRPFANPFAEMRTSASGTNTFCLHSSLQEKNILQTLCKETAPNFQLLIKI
jgi:hypothetical protein